MGMRPIHASAVADEQYGPFMWGEVDLLDRFLELSTQVRDLVPDCVGMSASLREHGVTLTLVSSDELVGALDAMQYVDGGPCVQALMDEQVLDGNEQRSLDEEWELFAAASRHGEIASTLSLPVPWESSGVLGFNLYAASAKAFLGLHEELADLLGAWAGGARVDTDLLFRTRGVAERAPVILREATKLAVQAGRLGRYRGIDVVEAQELLVRAAARAAVPLTALLQLLGEVLPEQLPHPPRSTGA